MAQVGNNIAELPSDVLMSCCHYLSEEDIQTFSEVNKQFARIGMDPVAMAHVVLKKTVLLIEI